MVLNKKNKRKTDSLLPLTLFQKHVWIGNVTKRDIQVKILLLLISECNLWDRVFYGPKFEASKQYESRLSKVNFCCNFMVLKIWELF